MRLLSRVKKSSTVQGKASGKKVSDRRTGQLPPSENMPRIFSVVI